MTLWLRTRRVASLLSTILAAGLLDMAIAERTVSLPVVVGTAGISLWSMFLPVAIGIAFADSLASKTQSVEARVGGRVVLLDVLLLSLTAGVAAAALSVCGGTHPDMSGTVGQVFLAIGLSAIATLRWGLGAGVLAPLALAVACLAYGVDAPGGEYVRLLAPDSAGLWDLTVGSISVLLAGGLIAMRAVRIDLRDGELLPA